MLTKQIIFCNNQEGGQYESVVLLSKNGFVYRTTNEKGSLSFLPSLILYKFINFLKIQ